MLRFLLLVLFALAVLAAVFLLARLVFALVRVVWPVVAAVLAALLTAVVASTLFAEDSGPEPVGIFLLAGLAAVLALLGTRKALSARRERPIRVAQRSRPKPPPPPPEPPADHAVSTAWDTLRAASGNAADRIDGARNSCARLLAATGSDCTDFSLLEWAVFIRKHLPELAGPGLADWRAAPAAERPRRMEQLIVSLENIGREAERRMDAAAPDKIATLHAHIEARTRGSD